MVHRLLLQCFNEVTLMICLLAIQNNSGDICWIEWFNVSLYLILRLNIFFLLLNMMKYKIKMTYSSLQVFKLVIEWFFGLYMRQLPLWLEIIQSILIELSIVVVNLSLESLVVLHLIFRIHNEWCCVILLLPWNLRMTLFTHFYIIYFLNINICIYILIFHLTLILPFFHFWIHIVCQITLIIWEVNLQLVCLPCLRKCLLHNQINFFIIFSDLAEYYRLSHNLINLIEWIVALIIHFILHYVAVTIVFRYLYFLFIRWLFFVFNHFP